MVTLLVPAAGFGERMGFPPAKELLIRPGTNKPFIDWPLELAIERNWRVVIISRQDKLSLNQYIENYINNYILAHEGVSPIQLLKISSSTDWYDSVMQSESYWSNYNIVFLPDVYINPITILDYLSGGLVDNELVVARHSVIDPQNWGHIYDFNKKIYFIEKPKVELVPSSVAWGLFGFQKKSGMAVLTALWKSQIEQKIQVLEKTCTFFSLEAFYDLTRSNFV
jgi:choline kinase